MTIFSKSQVEELRQIIKETTGRELSLHNAHFAMHYLVRLAQLIWGEERLRPRTRTRSKQLGLFD